MTPKQKAIELVDKYVSLTDGWVYGVQSWNYKKKCALIAVDEIIHICPYQTYKQTLSPYDGAELSVNYWEEVQKEIEKL